MERAVVLFVLTIGCPFLHYCSPPLLYVLLFLDSLCVSTKGGAEAKCDSQMSTIPPGPPLCSSDDPHSCVRKATPDPWAAAIPPHQPQGGCEPCGCMQIRSGRQTSGRSPTLCSVEQYLGALVRCLLQLLLGKTHRVWFV